MLQPRKPLQTTLSTCYRIASYPQCPSRTSLQHARLLTSTPMFSSPTSAQPTKPNRKVKDLRPNPGPRPPIPTPQGGNFTPSVLGRPIGQQFPPRAGQNTGEKEVVWKKLSEDEIREKRHKLAREATRSYFQDYADLRHHRGKSFFANPRIFRSSYALYFPNLHGVTLASRGKKRDTTPVLRGKITVLCLYSQHWADEQVGTFVGRGERQNPEVEELLAKYGDVTQRVDVNVEENWVKWLVLRMSAGRIRRLVEKERHDKYFMLKKGITDRLRLDIGYLNPLVGYVYLIDQDCKIRWAGSGDAQDDEKEFLVRGLKALLQDAGKTVDASKKTGLQQEGIVREEPNIQKGEVKKEMAVGL
ncbi:hypothetical protein M501DRAFT_998476 [Patellaria atrata CBS 101060]|uniref:Mitochondrial ATPase complex subunit ATP10 n=1 Tax=Patellaria atrata CBS 101060 TaxID=1346257 RepID=A0A9P4SG02_9PEZI|nr:hypothetical protein M501DRAFT_998476 [Patellaria atrata CBS 101060]